MINRILKLVGKNRTKTAANAVAITDFICPLCGSEKPPQPFPVHLLEALHQHQFKHNILLTETLNFAKYTCSHCLATDRDRLYVLFIKKWLQALPGKISVVEIGPSDSLRTWFLKQPNLHYRSADFNRMDVDDRVDVTNMLCYRDNSFDLVICSHVLEHVMDDRAGMKELYRILKPGGIAIIMVPINLGVDTTEENPYETDTDLRWHLYGQDDHVRMYSKQDFINRLADAGFELSFFGQDHFGTELFKTSGIFPTSLLYVSSKKP